MNNFLTKLIKNNPLRNQIVSSKKQFVVPHIISKYDHVPQQLKEQFKLDSFDVDSDLMKYVSKYIVPVQGSFEDMKQQKDALVEQEKKLFEKERIAIEEEYIDFEHTTLQSLLDEKEKYQAVRLSYIDKNDSTYRLFSQTNQSFIGDINRKISEVSQQIDDAVSIHKKIKEKKIKELENRFPYTLVEYNGNSKKILKHTVAYLPELSSEFLDDNVLELYTDTVHKKDSSLSGWIPEKIQKLNCCEIKAPERMVYESKTYLVGFKGEKNEEQDVLLVKQFDLREQKYYVLAAFKTEPKVYED